MRGIGGAVAVAVAVAALLVCCSADSHQEQDGNVEHNPGDRFDATGHKTRNLDPMSGGHLVRAARDVYHGMPILFARRLEYGRSELDPFVKRNFDEIDQTSMPFPYAAKRFYHLYGNHLDTPPYSSGFDKKRLYRPEYPMDEIDLSHFPIGSKRSLDSFLLPHARR